MQCVCFYCGDISRSGGTERVTTVIASELASRGYRVFILSHANGESTGFPLHPQVALVSLGMQDYSANLSDFRAWFRLRRFIRQHAVDVLIDVDVILSWYSIPASWGTATRVLSWEHFHYFINIGDRFQRCRRYLGRRLAARFAQALVVLTEKDRRQYREHLASRARLLAIPNPLTIVHQSRATPDSRLVLAAGRLVPQKGFDLLLQAWSQVAADRPPGWRLRIVGSGQDETMLKALCRRLALEDSVEFVGNTDDMASQFLDAAIYVLSSRFEGFALVLLEARSFGLPVVSFDCDCGPADIVRDGRDGLLVTPGDVTSLARAMRRLIEDESCRRAMGQLAYEDRRFALQAVVDQWQELIG